MSDPSGPTRTHASTSQPEIPIPGYLSGRFIQRAALTFVTGSIIVHAAGFLAYRHWHGFNHAPANAAVMAIQPMAVLGLLVHVVVRHFGSREALLPRWQEETHKSVVAWEVGMIVMASVLLWSQPQVSSDTAYTLTMSGATASFVATASTLVLVRHRRSLVRKAAEMSSENAR